jgi:hypothetical protein
VSILRRGEGDVYSEDKLEDTLKPFSLLKISYTRLMGNKNSVVTNQSCNNILNHRINSLIILFNKHNNLNNWVMHPVARVSNKYSNI